jgi:hypothetical protein
LEVKFFSGNTAVTKTIRDRCILTVGAPLQGCKIGNRGKKQIGVNFICCIKVLGHKNVVEVLKYYVCLVLFAR